MSPLGSELMVTFDQPTDRARMASGAGSCSNLFTQAATNTLGMFVATSCIWEDAAHLLVRLGTDATLLPGLALQVCPHPRAYARAHVHAHARTLTRSNA